MKKSIYLALLVGLFLFGNSCHDDQVGDDADYALKTGLIKKNEIIANVKYWFESSQELNSFELLKWTGEIKWSNALVVETKDSIIIEVPIKLKERYKVLNVKDPSINVEHRLLFVKSKDTVTPYLEYFSSKKDLGYLQDTEKVNYWKKTEDFEGAIVLQNTKNEVEIIYQWETVDDCEEVSLKSAILDGGKCYGLYEHFSDGSSELITILYCTGSGTSSGGGGSEGSYTPTIPCNCEDFCPVCHKCLQMLKNAIADPEGGGGSTTETVVCEMCTCPPSNPIPSISSLSSHFRGVAKMTAKDVYYLIGGNVLLNYQSNPTAFSNACALRLSYTLNSIPGSEIPFIEGKTLSGDVDRDGIKEWYFYRVSDMVNYLNSNFGSCTLTDTDHIQGMTGIIWQSDCGWDDASGHIDIWNSNNALGHYYDRCSVIFIWRN